MTDNRCSPDIVTALIWEVDRAVKQAAREGGKYETTIRHILNEHLRGPEFNCTHSYKMMVMAALDDACPLCLQINLNQAVARIEALEAALRKIADAPAWGAPDRWETTPAEVRHFARAALAPEQDK